MPLIQLPQEILVKILKQCYPPDTTSMDFVLSADNDMKNCSLAHRTLYSAGQIVLDDIRLEHIGVSFQDVSGQKKHRDLAETMEDKPSVIAYWRDVEDARRDKWACCLDLFFDEEMVRDWDVEKQAEYEKLMDGIDLGDTEGGWTIEDMEGAWMDL